MAEVTAGGTIYVAGTIDVYAGGNPGDQNGIVIAEDVTVEQAPDSPDAVITGPGNTTLEPGSLLTISGAYTVDLDRITFENGDSSGFRGGAVSNNDGGTLTIDDCTFSDNGSGQRFEAMSGGAVDNGDQGSGTLTVIGSTFEDNQAGADGGALDNADNHGSGMVTIEGSTFTDNSDTHNNGGAIDNADNFGMGVMTVENSTFGGNVDTANGGAIDNGNDGGTGTLTVSGSTFDANTAAEGGALDNSNDGIPPGSLGHGSGTLTIEDSSFTGNVATEFDGGAIDSANNGSTGTVSVTGSTFTDNHANIQDGGAIDSADHGGSGSLTVAGSTFAGNVASQNDGGAIDSSDNGSHGSLVVVDSAFNDNSSPRQEGGAIDSGDLNGNGTAQISDSTFTGNTAQSGGAVSNGSRGSSGSSLTVDSSTFASNDATAYDGGAIESGDQGGTATLDVTGSTFSSNEASVQDGGAIDSGDHGGNGSLAIVHSAFIGNQAPHNDGGAIDSGDNAAQGSLVVNDSTFSGNASPEEDGGAIDSGDRGGDAMATISGSTFSGNAAESGGAVSNAARASGFGVLTLTADTLAGDTSPEGAEVASSAGAGDGAGDGQVYEAANVFDGSCVGNGSGWTDAGYNAASSVSCLGTTAVATDAPVSSAVAGGLEPLAANGALLQTILMRADDPAVGLIPAQAPGVTLDGTRYPLCPVTDERGYSNPSGTACNAGATQLAVPVITATLTSTGTKSAAGWWDAPVTATFACRTVAPLTGPCPAPVTFSANQAGQTVTEAITGLDHVGGDSVTVAGVNVDQGSPSVAIGGPVNGRRYRKLPPGSVCHATDSLSGLASCTLRKIFTRTRRGYREKVVATATSNAGLASSTQIHFSVDETPSVSITGPVAGATYLGRAPHARCRARRTASPIRSCSLRITRTKLGNGFREILRARAISRTGQTAHAIKRFTVQTSVPPRIVDHHPLYNQVYALAYGRSYRIVVISRSRPRYVFAVPYPLRPSGGNLPFSRFGTINGLPRWQFLVTLPRKLPGSQEWNIGVRVAGELDVISVRQVRA